MRTPTDPAGRLARERDDEWIFIDLAELNYERGLRGWTKGKLAAITGLPPARIAEIYRTGRITHPRFDLLLRVLAEHPPAEVAYRLVRPPAGTTPTPEVAVS